MMRSRCLHRIAALAAVVLLAPGCGSANDDGAFTETEGFTYLTIDEEVYEGDIYVPEGEGPWPVVVMFHGNYANKDDPETTVAAEAAAAAGMETGELGQRPLHGFRRTPLL